MTAEPSSGLPVILVACGVLRRATGEVLLAQRPPGKVAALKWEFPGGKIEPGESPVGAIDRELFEELGILIHAPLPLLRFTHAYSDRIVILDTWLIEDWDDEPHGKEGQRFEWVHPEAARDFDVLSTVLPILAALRFPPHYVFTPPDITEPALLDGLSRLPKDALLRLRLPALDDRAYAQLATRVIPLANSCGLRVIADRDASLAREVGAAGVHVREQDLEHVPGTDVGLRIASCHTAASLARAERLGYDAAVVGPVLSTTTHPGQAPLGWDGFEALVTSTNLPVYGIGGLVPRNLLDVWSRRGRGMAAISAYWARGVSSASSSPSDSTAGIE